MYNLRAELSLAHHWLVPLNLTVSFKIKHFVFYSQLDYLNSSHLNEEYTQRLAAMEKKFQQAIREKDQLQKQLDVNIWELIIFLLVYN